MRCIFCKTNSKGSISVEHIVPESLGNTSQILPPGVVCDRCNNYFASKVEKKFLESPILMSLRFHQSIGNKKGRIPSLDGVVLPDDIPIKVYKSKDIKLTFGAVPDEASVQRIIQTGRGEITFEDTTTPPDNFIVSRFLAMMALEAIAQRFAPYEGGLDYLIDEPQFDPIRNHARRGHPRSWPYYVRRIYEENTKHLNDNDEPVQTIFEYTLFWTPHSELYFVIAIFGLEFAINVGGPELEGYEEWLSRNGDISPLYPFGRSK